MTKPSAPDQTLMKMPSLRAVKSFVAAAKYLNFTRAAESLCVTQAAISRQIRELEAHLGTPLFRRVGRSVELTQAGSIFFDAAQLSFLNIAQAADRIRRNHANLNKRQLTVCCSTAFSALWMSSRLPSFFSANPDIDLSLVTTQNFLTLEPGVQPDVFITKMATVREGFTSQPLFHDVIFPVCTPHYLEQHPEIAQLDKLRDGVLLNLTPIGRAQVSEHVDWGVWLAIHGMSLDERPKDSPHIFNANDYNMLMEMVLCHQGVALGWEHLIGHLLEDGRLVRPVEQQLDLEDTRHYLSYHPSQEHDEGFQLFRDWFLEQCHLPPHPH